MKKEIKLGKFTAWLIKRFFKKQVDKFDSNKNGILEASFEYDLSTGELDLETK